MEPWIKKKPPLIAFLFEHYSSVIKPDDWLLKDSAGMEYPLPALRSRFPVWKYSNPVAAESHELTIV